MNWLTYSFLVKLYVHGLELLVIVQFQFTICAHMILKRLVWNTTPKQFRRTKSAIISLVWRHIFIILVQNMEMMTLKALHVLNRAQACLIQSFFLRFCKSKSSHNFLNFIAPLVIRDFSLCQWDNFAWKGHLDYDVTACQLKVIQIKVLFFPNFLPSLRL